MTEELPPASSYETAPFPELTLGQLRAVVGRHELEVPDAAIQRLPSTGVINSIWALGDRWVLRVAKMVDEGVSDTRTESVAAPVAHAAGVRTPALVAFDDSGEIVENLYTIYERVRGETLDAAASPPAAVLEDLGVQLATLHQGVTSCPDPRRWLDDGGRCDDADVVLAMARQWAPWLEDTLMRIAPAVTNPPSTKRLLHNDVQPTNVMVTARGEAVLIDWGDAGWGDATTDLRSVPPAWIPAVLRGYRRVMPVDGDDTAEQRVLWDQSHRALYYAPQRPWLLEELRASVGARSAGQRD